MTMHINPLLFEGEYLVRSVGEGDNPKFVGLDVCRVLGIRDHAQALERLDDDERGRCTIPTPGGDQTMITITEAGVYRLVFTSRKPIAERFKRWLAHDVIPSIRKTGSYTAVGQSEVLPPQPPMEPRPFPDWPLEEMRTKKNVVDMYRMLYGCMAAQWIAPQVGFPAPPMEMIDHGRQYTMTLVPLGEGL